MKSIRMWWEEKKYKWACKIIKGHGFNVVKFINVAGTDYICGPDGRMYAVGRRKK